MDFEQQTYSLNRKSGKRGHTNHRLGEWYGRAKYPDSTVRRARALYAELRSYEAVGRELGVPWRTVADWVRGDIRWSS